jgi:hypothetical protein
VKQVKGNIEDQRSMASLLLNAHPHDTLVRVNHTLQAYPPGSSTTAVPAAVTLLERSTIFGESLVACCSRSSRGGNNRTATMHTHARTDSSALETLHVEVIVSTTLAKGPAKGVLTGVGRVLGVCFRSGGWFVHADDRC